MFIWIITLWFWLIPKCADSCSCFLARNTMYAHIRVHTLHYWYSFLRSKQVLDNFTQLCCVGILAFVACFTTPHCSKSTLYGIAVFFIHFCEDHICIILLFFIFNYYSLTLPAES